MTLTKHRELNVLGDAAQAVGGSQAVDGTILPAGLLHQEGAPVLIHQFVDVLIILDGQLLLGFGHAGFVPGEGGEWAAADLSNHTNITALLSLQGLTERDGGSDYTNRGMPG